MKIIRHSVTVLIFSICLFCFGCATTRLLDASSNYADRNTKILPAKLHSAFNQYAISVKILEGNVKLNESFDMRVQVSDIKGNRNSAMTLLPDATMPSHYHGMNYKPEVISLGAGRFLVKGMILHMIGEWVITIDVCRDGEVERAQCTINLQ